MRPRRRGRSLGRRVRQYRAAFIGVTSEERRRGCQIAGDETTKYLNNSSRADGHPATALPFGQQVRPGMCSSAASGFVMRLSGQRQ